MKIHHSTTQRGFSLIEMIGVLAIIAILLSAATPNVIKLIKNERYDAEELTVEQIGESLRSFVLAKQIIPGNTGWADSLASYADLSVNDIANTLNGTRRYIVHPSFTLDNFPTNAYHQDSLFIANDDISLSVQPTQAQIMIVSNLYANLPTTALTEAQFIATWNQSGAIPAGFTINDSVSIERVSLNALFHSAVFNTASAPATWALNTTDPLDEAPWPTNPTERYLLQGSKVYTRGTTSGNIEGIYNITSDIALGAPPSYESSNSGISSSGGVSSSSAASCGAYPEWNSSTQYSGSSEVYYSVNRWVYRSIRGNNTNNVPTNTSWWVYLQVCP